MWKNKLMLFEDENRILRCRGRPPTYLIEPNIRYSFPAITTSQHCTFIKLIPGCCTTEGDPHRATFEVLGDKGESRGEMIYSTITFTTCFRVREDPPFANTGVDFAGPRAANLEGLNQKCGLYCTSPVSHRPFTCK